MDFSGMSYGNMMFYGGIALTLAALLALIIGSIVFNARKKSLKKKLIDKYGF